MQSPPSRFLFCALSFSLSPSAVRVKTYLRGQTWIYFYFFRYPVGTYNSIPSPKAGLCNPVSYRIRSPNRIRNPPTYPIMFDAKHRIKKYNHIPSAIRRDKHALRALQSRLILFSLLYKKKFKINFFKTYTIHYILIKFLHSSTMFYSIYHTLQFYTF